MAKEDLPPWNTPEAKRVLTRRFYGMEPEEFVQRYRAGKFDFAKKSRMLKTLLLWFPELTEHDK